eukprot:211546-Prymnesium_polylepis.1
MAARRAFDLVYEQARKACVVPLRASDPRQSGRMPTLRYALRCRAATLGSGKWHGRLWAWASSFPAAGFASPR